MSCIYIYIHILWHSFWHILWHSISNSFWHSIWHLFWHTFWHILWHSFWHIFLTFYLASDLTFFLAFIRSATMSGILFGMYSGPCVAHSIRSWHRRSRQQRGGGGEGEGVAPLLKSRDPHLAGGIKKPWTRNYITPKQKTSPLQPKLSKAKKFTHESRGREPALRNHTEKNTEKSNTVYWLIIFHKSPFMWVDYASHDK